jgi:hypothetical protein
MNIIKLSSVLAVFSLVEFGKGSKQ